MPGATDLRSGTVARRGLTTADAAARLARDGPNVLPLHRPVPAWRQLGAQMVHFFALVLWVAGVLAFVAGMPQLGVAIFVVVVINGVFAFAQEHRAERAAERLRELLPRRAAVLRDGRAAEIDARDLVDRDVVLLRAGDHVSADMTIVECRGLAVDTSTLTGESVPSRVGTGDTAFAGTFVTEGDATAVVTATGHRTRLASIARLTQAGNRPRTPLATELHHVVRLVAVMAVGVGAAFFAVALLVGTSTGDGFLFAVGVTVALVPEGLLPTVTLSLARGAQRMAGHRALVRRLEAVETLGSTTFVCTDKTGTLTRNQMAVVAAWTPAGSARISSDGYDPTGAVDAPGDLRPSLTTLAHIARRCSDGRAVQRDGHWVARGDPMEAAIDVLARRLDAPSADASPTARYPFDPRRRRMSVVDADRLMVKGAPDSVLARCTPAAGSADAEAALAGMTRRGLRVLAVATRPVRPAEVPHVADTDPDELERDLELVGLLAFEDPPRPDAADALAACRRARMRVAMVTGDHPATAEAIARQTGLWRPGRPVLVGTDLPADDDSLGELLDHDGVVVSRVEPEQKLRIARALRARGHVVAMTGDGVNDGPALQEADIGIAMGQSGTDVAREAADLVLLDDHFATIVAAVEEGRATFRNIRRFLTYHLTDNVAELTPFVVWALTGGSFPLALGVLQILALDIGTDLLPALALGAEPPPAHVLDRPPERGHLLTRDLLTRVFGVLGPAEAAVEMLAFVVGLAATGWWFGDPAPTGAGLAAASGAAFTAVVVGQLANAFACRSTTRWVGAMRRANPLLVGAAAAEIAALLAFLYLPPLADLLDHRPPGGAALLVALLAAPAVIVADTAQKWCHQRRRGHRPSRPGTDGPAPDGAASRILEPCASPTSSTTDAPSPPATPLRRGPSTPRPGAPA